jgi:large subunit ribosomal protein L19
MDLIKFVEKEYLKAELPSFKAGDKVTVHYKIKEGNKERIQLFQGDVIQRRNSGLVLKEFSLCIHQTSIRSK